MECSQVHRCSFARPILGIIHLQGPEVYAGCRGAYSPDKLLCHFSPPLDQITTLYDALETSVANTPEVVWLQYWAHIPGLIKQILLAHVVSQQTACRLLT